jgi:hypothetical protein
MLDTPKLELRAWLMPPMLLPIFVGLPIAAAGRSSRVIHL